MPALQLTADDHLSRRIDAVDLKHRLGDVETDCRDRLHAWLPITATAPAAITQWHLRAGGGAVHSIRSRLCEGSPSVLDHSGSPALCSAANRRWLSFSRAKRGMYFGMTLARRILGHRAVQKATVWRASSSFPKA